MLALALAWRCLPVLVQGVSGIRFSSGSDGGKQLGIRRKFERCSRPLPGAGWGVVRRPAVILLLYLLVIYWFIERKGVRAIL